MLFTALNVLDDSQSPTSTILVVGISSAGIIIVIETSRFYVCQTYTLLFANDRLKIFFQNHIVNLVEVQGYTQMIYLSFIGFFYTFQ
jgi:hypothetical protein